MKRITTYADCYTCKFLNARLIARKLQDGTWFIVFIKVSKNDWTKKEKKKFDVVVERLGMIYTKKYLRLSDDGMKMMVAGYISFNNNNIEPAPMHPSQPHPL